MKKLSILIAALCAGLLGGCVVTSVYPFYLDTDVVFEPSLVGSFAKASEPDEVWKFDKEGDNAYRLNLISKTDTNQTLVHAFKLKGQLFLDCYGDKSNDGAVPEPVPSHCLLRVRSLTPTLKLENINYEWIGKLVEKNPKAIRHIIVTTGEKSENKQLVLTADTAELQKFVVKYLENTNAWEASFDLSRQQAGAAK